MGRRDREPRAPVRIERDGDVAVVVLDNPPLNLFDAADVQRAGERRGRTRRAHRPRAHRSGARGAFEARGKVVSAGVDVALFRDIAESPQPVRLGADLWTRLLRVAADLRGPPGAPPSSPRTGSPSPRRSSSRWPATSCWPRRRRPSGWSRSSSASPRRWAARSGSSSGPGPARARELIFTGERYAAAVLERWNVVNRVLPDEGFAEAARGTPTLAAGPTSRTPPPSGWSPQRSREGARAADALVPEVSGRALRHRRSPGCRRLVPDRGAGEGHLHGSLNP